MNAMMNVFAASGPHISIAPEVLFRLGPLEFTNSQFLGLIGSLIVLGLLGATARAIKQGSRSRFMHAILALFESLYDTTIEVIGDRQVALKVLPLAVTIVFFFVI